MPTISQEFIDLQPPKFQNYIFIETSSLKPSSISMAAAAGNYMKYIEDYSLSADLPAIQKIVREHYKEHQGQCALYGSITGFIWVRTPTEGIKLDVDGNE